MFQWFHVGCLSPVLNSGLWFGHVIWMQECWSQLWTPTPTRVPLLFCLFGFLITSLFWFFGIISIHTTVCLTDTQNIVRTSTTTRETFTDTRKQTETETNKQKRRTLILISTNTFILTSLFLQSVVLFLLSYTTDRKLPALMQITGWKRNSGGAESNVTWLMSGSVGLGYRRI